MTDGLYYKKVILSWLFKGKPLTGQIAGQVQFTISKRKKHGPVPYFHENGSLTMKGPFKDNEREGSWVYVNNEGTKDKRWSGTHRTRA